MHNSFKDFKEKKRQKEIEEQVRNAKERLKNPPEKLVVLRPSLDILDKPKMSKEEEIKFLEKELEKKILIDKVKDSIGNIDSGNLDSDDLNQKISESRTELIKLIKERKI